MLHSQKLIANAEGARLMAFKYDSFWEDHLPIGAEGPYMPGLRLYEVVDRRYLLIILASLTVCLAVLGVLELIGLTDRLYSPIGLLMLCLITLGFIRSHGAHQRFRLFDDNSATPEFDGKPERLETLLRRVAASKRLMGRLTLPESFGDTRAKFWGIPSEIVATLPLGIISGGLGAILLSFGLAGWHAGDLSGTALVVPLVLFALAIAPPWWLYRRLYAGAETLSVNVGGENTCAKTRLSAVTAAELQWDRLLERPFLRLELDGKPLHLYGPSSEPLYLLRVAKYCMPHLDVKV